MRVRPPDLDALQRDVVLANHIVHRVGLVSAYGHVSARIPGTQTFLIPTRASPALAREDRLLLMDVGGNRIEGEGTPNSEFWIHARIYAARPDVGGVGHVHSPACVVLGQISERVAVMFNQGAVFGEGVPIFERAGLIRSRELGDQVAATLGHCRAMLLRGHGANVADADVRRATVLACYLEENVALQLRALAAAGGDRSRLRSFSEEEAERVCEENTPPVLDRAWEYYSALAERKI
ncbi:MAG TPA: class II aldolase/adducin family protein [Chloroflexota bacterium]|nr:class II aldolase/adducin family protein [Chloroflexota bacterium]